MAEVEDAVTTIIGLDFGSHMASIALWTSVGKANVEVVADDLGFRMIPTAVAYRPMGDKEVEVITGQSAISQQAKNPTNTFDDVRTLLLNPNITSVNVPALGKEVPVEEIASHFFRNIHNQIKQQVGKVIRDTILSLPISMEGEENEMLKKRVIASAQAGGIRIKSFIQDSVATLLSYKFDDISTTTARGRTLVLDMGWSSCQVSLYNVSAGLMFPISSQTSAETCGSVFVKLLVEFCAKDFTRKTKCPFPEYSSSNKAVVRLKRECENAIKSLSMGTEAQIDIDSLYEGMDYSSKITRARFEDLITIPIIQMKKMILALVETQPDAAAGIAHVCLSGGLTAMPKVISTVKALLPSARFAPGKFEQLESPCIGAALHARALSNQNLINNAPIVNASATLFSASLWLSASADEAAAALVLPANSALPASVSLPAKIPEGGKGYLKIFASGDLSADKKTAVGEVSFAAQVVSTEGADLSSCTIVLAVAINGEVSVEITQTATSLVVASLTIPAK